VGYDPYMRETALALLLALGACSDSGSPTGDGHAGDGLLLGDGVHTGEHLGDGKKTGSGKVGDPCTRDEDCVDPADAKCFTTIGGGPFPKISFPGGYCSKDCSQDGGSADCGTVGGCATIGMSGGQGSVTLTMCVKSCKKKEDCRTAEGYTCRIILFGLGYCAL